MSHPHFTVFTPTFNRAHTLERPYRSLCAQSSKDFEWLIVDDGSSDGTRQLVEKWQVEGKLKIRYFWQENRGKHVAFNRAVREAQGSLFLTLDSDDECVPEALERLAQRWDGIEQSQRPRYSGLTCLCRDQTGALVGDRFPADTFDCGSQALRYRYGIRGEKWGLHRIEVLRDFPFPEPEGLRFVPEAIVWNAISRRYITRYVNDVLRIYNITVEPNESLSTQSEARVASGNYLLYQSLLNDDLRWFFYAPRKFLVNALLYSYFGLLANVGLVEQFKGLRWSSRLLWAIVLPASVYKYLRDTRGWKRRNARRVFD